MRILYLEGEPRWEYKFIRRAITDTTIRASNSARILRTTQNKTLRSHGPRMPHELENGFPTKPEDLFAYDGLIIGSVEANYFTPAQQQMIRDFADRRGGGVLFHGGPLFAERRRIRQHADGGNDAAAAAPTRRRLSRNFADATLTEAGRESVICRLEEGREANIARWKKMPQIANYAVMGAPKPGAVVLMNVAEAGTSRRRRCWRSRITATAAPRCSPRQAPGAGKCCRITPTRRDFTFWQQLLRWLVTETPGQVAASTPHQVLSDDTQVPSARGGAG